MELTIFGIKDFVVSESPLQYLAAEKTTVLLRLGANGRFAKLCTIIFSRHGSLFVQFTDYKSGAGLASAVECTVAQDLTSQLSLAKSGKVAVSKLKYSHPPDGKAHFSQDGLERTEFWSRGIDLRSGDGPLFEIHAHHLAPFASLDLNARRKRRLYLPFSSAEPPSGVSITGEWRSKEALREFCETRGKDLDVVDEVPTRRSGGRFRPAILGQPAGYPLQDHLLLLQVHPITAPASIQSSSLIFMGGFAQDAIPVRPGDELRFLSFMYPIANPDQLAERVGSTTRSK